MKIALELVSLSYQGDRYDVAVECVSEARKQCVAAGEFASFNTGMYTLSTSLKKQHSQFWSKLVDAKISLIDSGVVDDSDVTPEQASKFLTQDTMVSSAVHEKTDDEDDAFDDLDD